MTEISKPNILFILVDSLRADKVFGKNKTSKIPNTESLIKNGVGSIKRARKKIEVLHIFNPDSNHKSFQILVLMIYKRCSAMKNSMIIKKNHIVSSKIIT